VHCNDKCNQVDSDMNISFNSERTSYSESTNWAFLHLRSKKNSNQWYLDEIEWRIETETEVEMSFTFRFESCVVRDFMSIFFRAFVALLFWSFDRLS
jgi:hypothetical protein